jgi:hypothetical protein
MKKIGISVAALCAVLAFAKPPAAAAADRDDYNYRPSYRYSEGRNSYEGYQRREHFRNDNRKDRQGKEWREHDRADQRQRGDDRDRDRDNSYDR